MTKRRTGRGYDQKHMSAEDRATLKAFEKTNLLASILEAVWTILSIPICAFIYCSAVYAAFAIGAHPIVGAATAGIGYILVSALIARQQRGLELMVHDASHGCWYRGNRKVNHLFANLLVAVPVLSWLSSYWKSHARHHGGYGGHEDPCKKRFKDMGVHDVDLSSRWKIACAVWKWLPQYNAAYYKEIGSLSFTQWARFCIWHLTVFIVPTAAMYWAYSGANLFPAFCVGFVAWVIFWMLPATSALPVLRSIAEAEEHDYEIGDTEFDTTFTNSGWWHKALIHPKNDAYHLVHHMFPNIPERVHHKVHKFLMERDPLYQKALHRTSVLQKL